MEIVVDTTEVGRAIRGLALMRDGALKIEYVDGEVKGASIGPGLDAFYGRMFERAKKIAKRCPDRVENGIQVVVFGTFLLEAICNDYYKKFLFALIPRSELAGAIWEMTKRLAILEKLSAAAAVTCIGSAETDAQMQKVKLLFDLRNRLAHFKDRDTVWETSVDFISKPENWSKAPDPELMGHLTGQKLSGYISDIDDLLPWFEKVFGIRREKVIVVAG